MDGSRAVSEVVGTALLLGMLLVVVSSVLLVGAPALERMQSQMMVEKAELRAGDFVGSMVAVSDGQSRVQQFDAGGVLTDVQPDRGWVRVTAGEKTVVKETLGMVRFGGGETYLVFQSGALFRVTGKQALVRHSGDISYVDDTLTMSLLRIRGDVATQQRLRLQQGSQTQLFPTVNRTNPVEDTSLTLTIKSDYYRAWGSILTNRLHVEPIYDTANQTVSVTFLPSTADERVGAGIIAGTPTSSLVLSGGMSLDSYNSTTGPYVDGSGAGRVVVAGDLTLKGGAELTGGVKTGGNLTVSGGSTLRGPIAVGDSFHLTGGADVNSTVHGDAHVENDVTITSGNFEGHLVYGGTASIPDWISVNATQAPVSVSVQTPNPIAKRITAIIRQTRHANDNISSQSIDNGTLSCTRDVDTDADDNECRLSTGAYYLNELSLGSTEELLLDTTNGNITLVVNGDISIEGSSIVRVIGDNRVNVYTTGEYRQTGDGKVVNAGDDAPQFWLYPDPTTTVELQGGGRFVGVIYGPGTAIDVGSVPVYGALVGDIEFVESGVGIHYDSALAHSSPVPVPKGGVPVQYIHANLETVNATSAA